MDFLSSQARAAQLFQKDNPLLTGLEQVTEKIIDRICNVTYSIVESFGHQGLFLKLFCQGPVLLRAIYMVQLC